MSATFIEQPILEPIQREALAARAVALKADGQRLVQISCVVVDEGYELTYSFDKQTKLLNLRLVLPGNDAVVPSITGSYFCAFTYENELNDLFGIRVDGLALDFKGNFYRKAAPTPFAKSFSVNQAPGASPSN